MMGFTRTRMDMMISEGNRPTIIFAVICYADQTALNANENSKKLDF